MEKKRVVVSIAIDMTEKQYADLKKDEEEHGDIGVIGYVYDHSTWKDDDFVDLVCVEVIEG